MFPVGSRQTNLNEGDLLARLQDLQQRVDACERAVENETKDGIAELHSQVREIQDRVAKLDLEMHTRVLQIKKDLSKMIPQACSSSTLSNESSAVQLEAALELVRQEVAQTRQNVDIKLQIFSEESRLTNLNLGLRLKKFESGLADLNTEFNERKAKTAGVGARSADDQDGVSQTARQTLGGLHEVVPAQHLEDPQQAVAGAHLEQDAAAAVQLSHSMSRQLADGTQAFEFVVAESMWSLVFVSGETGATWLDLLISLLLLILSLYIQVVFSIIVSSPAFLGDAFEEQKLHAEVWRRTMAHNLFFVDLADTSLASRVCRGDGSLIVSTAQSDLVGHINAYLGTHSNPAHELFLEPPTLQPGICLCLLCIVLWCLAILTEIRDALSCTEAVLSLPKSRRTRTENGAIIEMSRLRATTVYACSLLRSIFAVWLLIVGIVWLARTISIQDLILNAVALGAVLDVDEMVFTAMMPKRLQIEIQHMEAIPISYSKGYEQVRSVAIFLCMPAAMIFSYYWLLEQLSIDMIAVKTRMCDGNINFAFAQNKQGMMYAARTEAFVEDRIDMSFAEKAVKKVVDYSSSDWRDVQSIAYTTLVYDIAELNKRQTESVAELVSRPEFRSIGYCQDYDVLPLFDQQYSAANWALLKAIRGINTNTCGDFRELCGKSSISLLRVLCPQTCRCDSPYKGLVVRTPEYGCMAGCGSLVAAKTRLGPCMDMPVDQDWFNIMKEMYEATTEFLPEEQQQTLEFFYQTGNAYGCDLIHLYPVEPVTGTNLCEGSSEIASLAGRCPVTCRCWRNEKLADRCPTSCFDYRTPCLDLGLPDDPDGSWNDCAEARAQGVCESHPDEAETYCRATCGFCCADEGVQKQSMLWTYLHHDTEETCAGVREAGLCESIPDLAAPYCRATCNLCTNTTPV